MAKTSRNVPRSFGVAVEERVGSHRAEDRHEVRRLIDEAYTEARRILTEKHDEFVTLAEGLLEYETLSGEEIKAADIRGEKPSRDAGDDTPTARGSAVPKAGPKRDEPKATASRKAGSNHSRTEIILSDKIRPSGQSGAFFCVGYQQGLRFR